LKKNISILVLSLFIYNTFGFLAVHPLLSTHYKNLGMKKVENYSGEEMIELLILNKEDIVGNKIDFKWIHSREFRYNGEMYDIVKNEESDNRLFLYCIHDKEEKKLNEEFAKKIQDNSTNTKHRQLSSHLNILLSEPVQAEKLSFALMIDYRFNNARSDFYNSVQLDIPSPPPRIA
jgi:hypothetical protein